MQENYILKVSFDEGTSVEPVLLTEMKTYLRVSLTETFNDTLIIQLIKTARQQLEGYLNISLIDKTVTARIENNNGYVNLPYTAPEITITDVIDNDGETVETDNYSLKADTFCGYANPPNARNNFYSPCNYIVTVTYDVAYPDGIPEHFKTAIMQQCSWLYEHRGDELQSALAPIVIISMRPYRRAL